MLITSKVSNENLSVKFNYCQEYVDRIRKVPGAYFDSNNKIWIVPICSFMWFEDEFEGEILFNTPRWVITKEPTPDYSKMYDVANVPLPTMKFTPFNYQAFGIRFMIDRLEKYNFVINADDVGLGKTFQAIGTMKHYMDTQGYKRILIICKKSLKKQWIDEINKFVDIDSSVYINKIDGKKDKRRKFYDSLKDTNSFILTANYHTIMNDADILKSMNFDMIIIDEAHCVKARTGVMNDAIRKVATKCKKTVFLTGTPIMSKPDDLFGIIQIADRKYFGKWSDFEKRYIKYGKTGRFTKAVGYKNLNELRDKCQDIIIRRTEFEVDLELPQTITKEIIVDKDNTQISIEEAINKTKDEFNNELNSIEKQLQVVNDRNRREILEQKFIQLDGMSKGLIAALQAVANDPRLFFMSKSKMMQKKYAPLIPKTYKSSSKMEALLEIIEEVLEVNQKIIIFSKFETCCRLIASDVSNILNVPVLLYTGDVNDEQREINIDLFKNSSDHNIIIMTNAGAEGINLQVANHVVNFDQPDTPAIKIQRIGRARRAGSSYGRVIAYDLITESSKDVERLENIKKAMELFNGLIGINEAQREALTNAMGG